MAKEVQYRPDVLGTYASSLEDQGAASDESSINLPVLLEIVGERKKTILTIGFVALAVAFVIATILPAQYTSSASLVPPGASASSGLAGQLSALSGLAGGSLFGGAKSSADLYVGILRSRTIGSSLVKQFHLEQVYGVKKESLAEKKLAAKSEFTVGTKDSIVTISVTDHNPERARDLTNAYLMALENTNNNLALTESSQRRMFFEKRLAQEKDALADAEVALKEAEEKTGLIAPSIQTSSKIQTIAQTRAQIISRQAQLASLLSYETEDASDVKELRAEIANLESQASRMETGTSKANHITSTAEMPKLTLEYIRKARDVSYHETLFGIIAKQYEAARLDEAHDAPLQILDHADLPDSRSGPPRALITIAGLFLGLLGSALWFVFQSRDKLRAIPSR